jgi:hypothetical protein
MMLGEDLDKKIVYSPKSPPKHLKIHANSNSYDSKEDNRHQHDSDDEPSEGSEHDQSVNSKTQSIMNDRKFVSPGNTPSSRSPLPKSKKVSFSADTIMPKEDNMALSITKHLYTRELGYTQYHIQVIFPYFYLEK